MLVAVKGGRGEGEGEGGGEGGREGGRLREGGGGGKERTFNSTNTRLSYRIYCWGRESCVVMPPGGVWV